MPSQLCQTCLSIPPHFWAEDLDDKGFPWGPYVKLQPYRSMEAAAAAGCPLCSKMIYLIPRFSGFQSCGVSLPDFTWLEVVVCDGCGG